MMMTSKLPYLRCIFLPAGNRASKTASRVRYNQSGILAADSLQIAAKVIDNSI